MDGWRSDKAHNVAYKWNPLANPEIRQRALIALSNAGHMESSLIDPMWAKYFKLIGYRNVDGRLVSGPVADSPSR